MTPAPASPERRRAGTHAQNATLEASGSTPYPFGCGLRPAPGRSRAVSAADRSRWDAKHSGAEPGDPAASVQCAEALLRRGASALDLGAGTGGNALFLAARGHRVVALDGSRVALAILDAAARRRGVRAQIQPILADLESPPLAPDRGSFDLVLAVSFLERSLLPLLPLWVRPGGLILVDTFHDGVLSERPAFRRDWVLERAELALLFPGAAVVASGVGATRAFRIARRQE